MTKKELWDALKDNHDTTCDICNTRYKYLTFMERDIHYYYICKYCFLNVRDNDFDETKELIHYCFRELDNWMDMIQGWEEEIFEGKNTKLDLYENEVDNVINKLQELKKLIKGDR